MKNRSRRYDINAYEYSKHKVCLYAMMVMCNMQHLKMDSLKFLMS